MNKISNTTQLAFSLILVSLLSLPSYANTDESSPDLLWASLRSFGSLLLIIALIVLAAWIVKRYLPFLQQPHGKGDGIKIISMKSLGPKKSVHLIEVEGKKVLIGSSDGGITLLKEFSDLELEK